MIMIKKGILGGLSIVVASYIYLQIQGAAGAFLFSIGLLLILNMDFKLFTGTIGFVNNRQDIIDNLKILGGNIMGTCGMALLPPLAASSTLMEAKLNTPLSLLLIKSIVCGGLVYCAVSCYRRRKDYMVVACVAGFILFGGEHCIADLCYIIAARSFSVSTLIFLIVVTVGNIIGAIVTNRMTKD